VTAPPEAELVVRLQKRDRDAWEQLYRLYEGRLYAVAYRLTGNSRQAADLVQETFIRTLPQLDRADPDAVDLPAVLLATMRNVFQHETETESGQPGLPPAPALGNEPADGTELTAMLRQPDEVMLANAHLPPRQRVALALRELEGRSYTEIAEVVGMPETAVAQLIAQARQSLRVELRPGDAPVVLSECVALSPVLSAILDGEVEEPQRSEALAHIAGCDDCRRVLEGMREISRRYRVAVPPPALAGLSERVDAALTATGYWERRPQSRRQRRLHRTRRLVGFALGVAVVGLLIGVVVIYPLIDTPDYPQLGPKTEPRPRQAQPQRAPRPVTRPAAPGAPAPPLPPVIGDSPAPPPPASSAGR
jgi:RNA polymerase sigma factor (sigma-70 family)